jgi:uncharacterized membrane protein YdjX (TVP38/TMEM64 family)
LTVVAWLAFIVYAHHLSHAYLGEIKSALGSETTQVIAQVVVLSVLVYLIILSLPFLPNLGVRGVSVLAMWSTILVLGHQLSHEGFHQLRDILASASGEIGIYGLSLGAFVYVLMLALPFVPGVEFGLLLMVLFGPEGVIIAYVATVTGLSLAYFVAQTVPDRITLRWMDKLGLSDATNNPKDAIDAIVVGRNATQGTAARLGSVFELAGEFGAWRRWRYRGTLRFKQAVLLAALRPNANHSDSAVTVARSGRPN